MKEAKCFEVTLEHPASAKVVVEAISCADAISKARQMLEEKKVGRFFCHIDRNRISYNAVPFQEESEEQSDAYFMECEEIYLVGCLKEILRAVREDRLSKEKAYEMARKAVDIVFDIAGKTRVGRCAT